MFEQLTKTIECKRVTADNRLLQTSTADDSDDADSDNEDKKIVILNQA